MQRLSEKCATVKLKNIINTITYKKKIKVKSQTASLPRLENFGKFSSVGAWTPTVEPHARKKRKKPNKIK